MLVKEPYMRYTIAEILKHPWISNVSSKRKAVSSVNVVPIKHS